MAVELLAGPAVGTGFGKLLSAVEDARSEAAGFNSNLQKLQTTLKSLEPRIQEIQNLGDELDRPREEMKDLGEILTNGEKLIQTCCKVSCWNYYHKWRYGKKISSLESSLLRWFQLDMQALQTRDGRETLVMLKSQRSSWSNRAGSGQFEIPGSCKPPAPPSFTVGLERPLQELKRRLFTHAELGIVVSAPGGCGKTTLAKKLCQDHEVKGKFKNIFYVTVSKTFNLTTIIKKLYHCNDDQVPAFTSEEDAVNQLEVLLKNKDSGPILLVLDDVWCGSESHLDKFKFQISGFKVLVTSRNEFPTFGSTYKLDLLKHDDAMALFRHSAFPKDGSCPFMLAEDLATEIVKHCPRFPLALEVVGSSLHGRPAEIWKSRLMKLSKGDSILNSEDRLLKCLQSSLDALDGRSILKECFMDLGSFSEDIKIPVAALIDMWAELYELDEDGVEAVSNLNELGFRNLLNDVVTSDENGECYNDAFVTQHDLLRELAIHVSSQKPIEESKRLIVDLSENRFPAWWTEEKKQLLTARLLSISTDEMFSSSWCNMQVPGVEVLILNFQTSKNYTLPEFMKQMDKLKVLVVTNYGFCPAELINFSLLGSISNLKRIRLEQVSIPTLCNANIELKNLEKISLVMCKIGKAFESGTTQLQEMLPNLTEINIDYCNDLAELAEGLCDLVQLKKLSITNCHKLSALPQGIGKLANLQVLRIRACTAFSKLPDSIGSLHKLSVLDITGCLGMREMPEQLGGLCSLRELYMRKCSGLDELPASTMDLKNLERVMCDEKTALMWETFKHCLPRLKIIAAEESFNLNWL